MSQPLTTQVASIAGVLARAVHPGSGPRCPRSGSALARRVVERQSAGVCSADSSRPRRRQDPSYAVDVEGLPRVRGAGQGQQLAGGGPARASTMPSACSGLLDERGRIGRATSPTDQSPTRRRRSARRSRSGDPRRTRTGRSRRRQGDMGPAWAEAVRCPSAVRWQDERVPSLPPAALPVPARARRPRAAARRRAAPAHRLQRARAARSPWTCRPTGRGGRRRGRSSWSTPRACRSPGSTCDGRVQPR